MTNSQAIIYGAAQISIMILGMIPTLFALIIADAYSQFAPNDTKDFVGNQVQNCQKIATLCLLAVLLAWFSHTICSRISLSVMQKLYKRSLKSVVHMKIPQNDVNTKFNRDIQLIGITLRRSIPNLVFSCVSIAMIVLLIILVTLQLAILTLIPLLCFYLAGIIHIKFKKTRLQQLNQAFKRPANFLSKNIQQLPNIVTMNAQTEIKNVFTNMLQEQISIESKIGVYQGISWAVIYIGVIIYVLGVFVFGGLLHYLGEKSLITGMDLDTETLVCLVLSVLLNSYNFLSIGPCLRQWQQANKAYQRIIKLQTEPNEKVLLDGKRALGEFSFKNVRTNSAPGLCGVTFQVKPLDQVVLLGEDDSGKNSVYDIILGFTNIVAGEVTLDAFPIQNFNFNGIKEIVGWVPSKLQLFKGTLLKNLTVKNPNFSMQELVQLSKYCNSHKFIKALPGQYNALVQYVHFTKAQKQRLCLLRALVTNPKILLIQSQISELEYEESSELEEFLKDIMIGRTTIHSINRQNVVKDMKQVIVFYQGEIIANNSPTHISSELISLYQQATIPIQKATKQQQSYKLHRNFPSYAMAILHLSIGFKSLNLIMIGILAATISGTSLSELWHLLCIQIITMNNQEHPLHIIITYYKNLIIVCTLLVISIIVLAYSTTRIRSQVLNNMRIKCVESIMSQPLDYLQDNQVTPSQLCKDVQMMFSSPLCRADWSNIIPFFIIVGNVEGSIVYNGLNNMFVTGLIMILLTISFIFYYYSIKKSTKGWEQEKVSEIIKNLVTIQGLGIQDFVLKTASKDLKDQYKLEARRQMLQGLSRGLFIGLVGILFMVPVFYGLYQSYNNDLEPNEALAGTIPSVMNILSVFLIVSLVQMPNIQEIPDYLFKCLTNKQTTQSKINQNRFRDFASNLKFKQVNIYKNKELVIRDLNFEIQPGNSLTIHSQQGKSALAMILIKGIKTYTGQIQFGNFLLHELPDEFVRANIGWASGNPLLFKGTLYQNIVIGSQIYNEKMLQEFYNIFHSLKFLENLSIQISDKPIGGTGFYLNETQLVILALTRALIRNPKILIVDNIIQKHQNKNQLIEELQSTLISLILLTDKVEDLQITENYIIAKPFTTGDGNGIQQQFKRQIINLQCKQKNCNKRILNQIMKPLMNFCLGLVIIPQIIQAITQDQNEIIMPTETAVRAIQQNIINYSAFAPKLDLGASQREAQQRIKAFQDAGIYPQPQTPDQIYWSRFKGQLCDEMVRFNMYMPGYNLAETIKKGRGVITGDMELADFLEFYEPEVQTSENTLDNAEVYSLLYDSALRVQNIYPQTIPMTAFSQQNNQQLLDQLKAIGSVQNEGDLIPNDESYHGFEVAFSEVNLIYEISKDLGSDLVVQAFDECIDLLESTYDFAYRQASAPQVQTI